MTNPIATSNLVLMMLFAITVSKYLLVEVDDAKKERQYRRKPGGTAGESKFINMSKTSNS